MTKNRPASPLRGGPRRSVDRDGVVRVELRRGGLPIGLLALGLAGASLLAVVLWQWRRGELASQAASAAAASARAHSKEGLSAPTRAPAHAKDAPTLRVAARSPDTTRLSNAPAAFAEALNDPSLPSPEDRLEDSPAGSAIAPVQGSKGVAAPKEGIAAFPAPGTKRIKPGLKVPEDFPLPPGYMRHYQATDKGLMLEPILVYHPDYELVDARGNVIPLPPDRVVPPESAPEGLPVETLEIPADAYADRDETGPSTNVDPGQTSVEEEKKPTGDEP